MSLHKTNFDILPSTIADGRIIGGPPALSREEAWCKAVGLTHPWLWWRLHERAGQSVIDYSGNGRDGTQGSDWLPRERAALGSIGGCARNSANGSVEGGDWQPQSPITAMTVGCWIKWNALANAGIVTKWSNAYPGSGEWALSKVSQRVRILISSAAIYEATSANLPDYFWSQWHWYVFAYNGTIPNVRIIIDGELYGSSTTGVLPANIPNVAGTNIRAGRLGTFYWNGGLDEVVIWDRAVPNTEIKSIWDSLRTREA